ncbi:hypothetical protein MYAM1_003083 [Malassezia yamatoensis]|uniref:NADH-ubiquinone oxidoreductase 21 kDa subunit n=1 Tax=Malassezia yamatoensis TaxID=253288 RepID=A0AAJ6CHX4_9BASI|nr:hypothetical protein MYAM1_003083 [Malassezia yamatoensis]
MPLKNIETPYPLIDADPHFRRVINNFRPSDYSVWAGTTAAFPGALLMMEQASPTYARRGLGTGLRLAGFLGAVGGFLFAYQRSSFRLWGVTENEREQEQAKADVEAGKVPGFGDSSLSSEMQGFAFRNSVNSQLSLAVLPWFNFVNHQYHGSTESE